jgi:threonine/homoserine/homoserine lactone efflux protein
MALWHNLLHLSLIHILVAMVPGPNTVIVSHFSAADSRQAGLKAVAGIAMGSFAWVTLSLFGVGVVLLEAGAVYRALRIAGAAYLAFVGLRMLWSAWWSSAASPGKPAQARRSPVLAGLLTNLSNPKSAVFWTSVFVLIMPPHPPVWFMLAAIGIAVGQTALWYSLVALFLSTPLARNGYARLVRWMDAVAGAVMLGLGLKLADDVRAEIAARLP